MPEDHYPSTDKLIESCSVPWKEFQEHVYYNPYRDQIYIVDDYAHYRGQFKEMPEIPCVSGRQVALGELFNEVTWTKCVYLGVL